MNSKISFFNPKIAILILFNLVITSCGSAFLSLSTTSQINKGMSMNEVKRILGEPIPEVLIMILNGGSTFQSFQLMQTIEK